MLRLYTLVVAALMGAACACARPDPPAPESAPFNGARLDWFAGSDGQTRIVHGVSFPDGRWLGLDGDHDLAWFHDPPELEAKDRGRICQGFAKPVIGQRVIIRSAWDSTPGTIVAFQLDSRQTMIRTDRSVLPGCSGAGAWLLDKDEIVGIVQRAFGVGGELTLVIAEAPPAAWY